MCQHAFYSCSPPCKDVLEVYSGVPTTLRKRVCRSTCVFEVTLQNRFATVMFTTDAIQGTGRGFTGNFSSYGLCLTIAIIFCSCHRVLIWWTFGMLILPCYSILCWAWYFMYIVPIQWWRVWLIHHLCMFVSDHDECQEFGHLCQHSCINLQGSFRCVCPSGMYAPETRKFRCLGELPLNRVYSINDARYITYSLHLQPT